jgi:hypothetical protein
MPNPRIIKSSRPSAKSSGDSSGKKKWVVIAALFLLFAGVGAWAMSSRTDPHVLRVQELRVQMENAPPEQRRELWGQMRQEFEQMPEASREALFEDRRKEWEAREDKYMTEFFAKTKQEQIAEIDKRIDESEKRRKEREKRRAQGNNGNRGDRGQLAQAGGNGGGGGGRGPGGGGGQRGAGGRDSLERRKGYLDKSSPDSRAQRGAYRRMMEERRAQRGLPADGGRRR